MYSVLSQVAGLCNVTIFFLWFNLAMESLALFPGSLLSEHKGKPGNKGMVSVARIFLHPN